MYKDKRILAIIPARGGSKGIKDKNIYLIKGRPLIAYSIDAARSSKYIDYAMVSTESEVIAEKAKENGARVPFMRPVELAADTSKTIDAIFDAITRLKEQDEVFDVLVLLQPTSPLRTSEDIDEAIELYFEEEQRSLVSIAEVNDNPVFIRRLEGNRAIPILNQSSTVRRQDTEKFYRINGAIYINKISEITPETSFNDNIVGYVMAKEKSVDIDCIEDIKKVEELLSQGEPNESY